MLEALAAPLRAGHKRARRCAAASASRSLDRATDVDADELIRDADAAMYIAKRDGKGGYRLFEPEMHEGVLARLELRADLQRAIADRPARAALPAVVRLDGRQRLRRRGAAALAPPRARASCRPTSSSRSPRRRA